MIGRILPERIDAALKDRFREQKVVEIETAELLADRAVKWLKTVGFVLGIPALLIVAALSFVGIKTWSDLQHVAEQAATLEKQLAGPQQQLTHASQQISQLSKELEAAKQSLAGQISQVGQRQSNLEDQLHTIRGRLGFCPEGDSSVELRRKLEDSLTNFIAWLESIGFEKLTDRISVCIYSEGTKMRENMPANRRDAFYMGDGSIYIHTSLASEPTVPLHAYSLHALAKAAAGANSRVSAEEYALADYLAASFLDTPIIGAGLGELSGRSTSYVRNLENDLHAEDTDAPDKRGEVWGGALWVCRKINRKQIDELVLVVWRAANAGLTDSRPKRFGAAFAAAPGPVGACLSAQIEKRKLPH